jgi:C1A family cysteine protease
MFGFYVFTTFKNGRLGTELVGNEGAVPFPGSNEDVEGGHAVVAVGYDDSKEIYNTVTGKKTEGAIKFVNSWGKYWGYGGFGWLPYKYVETYLAIDFWSIVSMKWLDTGRFGL